MRAIILVLCVMFSGLVAAQNDALEPVQWKFSVEKVSEGNYKLIYKAEIEDGWAIYSQYIEEGGPIATSFTVEESDGVEFVGDVVEPEDKEKGFDEIFEMELIKIKGSAEFYQVVKASGPSTVKGFLTFMSCDDSKCLPPADVDFEFVIE